MNVLNDMIISLLTQIQNQSLHLAYATSESCYDFMSQGCRNACSGTCQGDCAGSCDGDCLGGCSGTFGWE